MLERDAQRFKAMQVGMLMRAYRESFLSVDGARGLTQDELLRRMASVDSNYAQRYSHTTVSRWESGATRPSRERLEVFGRALNLSPAEVQGLMLLAGFDDDPPRQPDDTDLEYVDGDGERATASVSESSWEPEVDLAQPVTAGVIRRSSPTVFQGIVSCLLPAFATIGGAYLLASLGWNEMWMPIAYIGAVVGVRLGATFLRMSSPFDLCEFFTVSLFVLLTTPLLQSAALNTDHYGFCSIAQFMGTPVPYALALLVNLALSMVGGGAFLALWNWQYRRQRNTVNPIRRAAVVVLLPMGLIYATIAVITNTAIVLQLGVAFAFLAAAFIILLVMRDSTVAPQDRDRRFLLWAILIVGTVAATVGAVTMLAVYLTPNVPYMLPSENLLLSWTVDADSLGLSPEEVMQRLNVGYLWHAVSVFVYMVFFVGGNLMVATYRWGSQPPHIPGGESFESSAPPAKRTVWSRIVNFLSIGCYSIWRPR